MVDRRGLNERFQKRCRAERCRNRCGVTALFRHTRSGDNPMRPIIAITVLAATLLLAACNTVEGAGRDVSAAGHAVTDTAKDAK